MKQRAHRTPATPPLEKDKHRPPPKGTWPDRRPPPETHRSTLPPPTAPEPAPHRAPLQTRDPTRTTRPPHQRAKRTAATLTGPTTPGPPTPPVTTPPGGIPNPNHSCQSSSPQDNSTPPARQNTYGHWTTKPSQTSHTPCTQTLLEIRLPPPFYPLHPIRPVHTLIGCPPNTYPLFELS